jgi:succinate dehydrogenase / fumarate reductase iron-sulfur subunit
MHLQLRIWRQPSKTGKGDFVDYTLDQVPGEMSFLEMLDTLNQTISLDGGDPVAFDHDCREGICGTCSLVINGQPHGPGQGTTTCQVYMRQFKDNDLIVIEPFRARAFPVIKDLVVDRSAFDNIIAAGGFITVDAGNAQDANSQLIAVEAAELAMDAAACIGCGACVAACRNASAMLFVAAKVSHLGLLPQGQPEQAARVLNMVQTMDQAGFGNCSNEAECEAYCPKEISIETIARMNRQYLHAAVTSRGPQQT